MKKVTFFVFVIVVLFAVLGIFNPMTMLRIEASSIPTLTLITEETPTSDMRIRFYRWNSTVRLYEFVVVDSKNGIAVTLLGKY